ncbi:MAG TPA: cysteine desulfurase family protein [Candidatus Dormibacteraeota bacterium]|jgi:cysteine desulfurase|nr:cysteine desulfurase family protein [Candidatus Dormibacteraeota bacterium]
MAQAPARSLLRGAGHAPGTGGVYLDHAATTPVDPEVLEAMLPYLGEVYGNPSSVYGPGRRARAALDAARDTVAAALGGQAREIVFTSGGSESDNLAIRGVARRNAERGRHLVCSQVEHHAVLHTMQDLERQGFEVSYLPVDGKGRVDPGDLRQALRPGQTQLVSVMLGNNEVGTVEPVAELAELAHQAGAYFHTDAVQAFGKVPVRVDDLGVDLLSISAHKVNGPKGAGALYVRMGTRISPLITGGGHERNRRAGTENVAGIVGLARAAELAVRDLQPRVAHMAALAGRLVEGLPAAVPGASLTGHPTERLPHHASFLIPGVPGDSLLMLLDRAGVYASSGSACTSGSLEPSHVLLAMGISPEAALGGLRLTVGAATTAAEVDVAIGAVADAVRQLRAT